MIRIVREGLRGKDSIAECVLRRDRAEPVLSLVEGLPGGGKQRLVGDTALAATSDEVNDLRREAMALKEVVADLTLENRVLKKSVTGDGEDGE